MNLFIKYTNDPNERAKINLLFLIKFEKCPTVKTYLIVGKILDV